MQDNIKVSEPFLDYCHLTIIFPPPSIKKLSDINKQTLLNIMKRFVTPINNDHVHGEAIYGSQWKNAWLINENENINKDECPRCQWSFHSALNVELHYKNCINLTRSKNWSMGIHFTGGFFKSASWIDNYKQLDKYIQNLDSFLYQRLIRTFGFSYPLYELKVSRMDIAINFYNAHIWDPKDQTKCRASVKDYKEEYDGLDGRCTGITLSKYDTDKIYFRSYDKRYDENKNALDKAKLRFNTKDFVRNEWRIMPNKMRKLNLRNWTEWLSLFKDRSRFNQLVLHLRKSRDVTFFKNPAHSYNVIHSEKGWRAFKPVKLPNPIKHEWQPMKHVEGIIRNNNDKMKLRDYHKLLEIIKKDTDLIPPAYWRVLNDLWMDQGYFEKSYGWHLRNEGRIDE